MEQRTGPDGRLYWINMQAAEPAPVLSRPEDALCATCRHNRNDGRCTAFPLGIPTPILTMRFDHRNPWRAQDGWPSDRGIRYEPQDAEPTP